MTTGGFLRAPRARVMWGKINLSAYNGDQNFPQGTPLVYDVSVDLNGENQQPTGELRAGTQQVLVSECTSGS